MIPDTILHVMGVFVGWLGETFADAFPGVPAWFETGLDVWSQLLGYVYYVDTWVPVQLTITIAGAVVTIWAVSTTFQIVRTIVSYLTFGGGGT